MLVVDVALVEVEDEGVQVLPVGSVIPSFFNTSLSHLSRFSFYNWLLAQKTCDNRQFLANFVAETLLHRLLFLFF